MNDSRPGPPARVAVIGSGVAGLVAAYVASRTAHVTLLEADDRLGGHADTHDVVEHRPGGDVTLGIDTGFIVHNPRTYPVLLRLFAELGVATHASEMSMSIRDDDSGLEWAGALGRRGLFPTAANLRNPRYLAMLVEIPRFHRRAARLLDRADGAAVRERSERTPRSTSMGTTTAKPRARERRRGLGVEARGGEHGEAASLRASPWASGAETRGGGQGSDATLRQFLADGRFSAYFTRHFMEPLVAAVWSCDPDVALDYPARYLFTFLRHHGMLGVFGSPQWRTVTGGSRAYVDAVAAALREAGSQIRLGTKVTSVLATPTGVEVTDGNGETATYDAVVIATHPHQALAMLAEPTAAQHDVLGAMPYSPNTAVLHTDASLMPRAGDAWASWNFRRPTASEASGGVLVTYDLTRLQRLDTDVHYLVTLADAAGGGEHLIDPTTVIARREYEHPLYNPTSVAAQRRLPAIGTDRIAFAGAYHGWGFHEDGARSGLAAAERLGLDWPADDATSPADQVPTGTYETTIGHTRRRPWRRDFTHRSTTWVVDLDDLPDLGLLGRFEARDHLGDPDLTIKANVAAFLARHDLDLAGGRVVMAANARALGHCFNPISVFWCWDRAGRELATVVEVHNTYGDRHAYLVHPDAQGRARTDKAMYVSPFHGTEGSYDLAVPVPDGSLDVVVTLHGAAGTAEEGARFSASLRGRRADVGPLRAAVATIRHSALIRTHGIWLWLRRLPVRPRPPHHQDGVQSS